MGMGREGQEIGDRIRLVRSMLGLSQTEFAKVVGVSRGLVAQWETYRKQPGTDNLVAIVRHTRVSADYFLGFYASPEPLGSRHGSAPHQDKGIKT